MQVDHREIFKRLRNMLETRSVAYELNTRPVDVCMVSLGYSEMAWAQ